MTSLLTYADRERLLSTLDHYSAVNAGPTSKLLNEVVSWAKSLKPMLAFEHTLIRNVTLLSCHLRDHENTSDITTVARGAIRFVLRNQLGPPLSDESLADNSPRYARRPLFAEIEAPASESLEQNQSPAPELPPDPWNLLSSAFVASYAVHEISLRLGTPITYNPPAISKEEQAKAEDMFLRMAADSKTSNDDLIALAESNLRELDNLARCGFFRRLENNTKLLIAVLNDPEQSDEHKSYARVALRYLIEDDDVVSDDLGLIGYLDDHFVVQMAVDLINPDREPLVELLDEVVAAWPFINSRCSTTVPATGRRPSLPF